MATSSKSRSTRPTHHRDAVIKEEEKAGGMFAEARKARMDLAALGTRLAERKSELESAQKAAGDTEGAR